MDKRRGCLADQRLGRTTQKIPCCRAGEADTAICRVSGDEIHRIVSQKPIHRGAFGRCEVSLTLAVLGRCRNKGRLDDGNECRHCIEEPGRQMRRYMQARCRQEAQGLSRHHSDKRERGRHARAHDSWPVAGESCFCRD